MDIKDPLLVLEAAEKDLKAHGIQFARAMNPNVVIRIEGFKHYKLLVKGWSVGSATTRELIL
jgi:hypothetical protein